MSLPVKSTLNIKQTHPNERPIDIKLLTQGSGDVVSQLGPAFQKYNEEQLITVKLPGSSQSVCAGFIATFIDTYTY